MDIALYNYIYNKLIYIPPSKDNNYKISIINFNVNKYTSISCKYTDIRNILGCDWLKQTYDEKVITNLYITNRAYFGFLKLKKIIAEKHQKIYDYNYDICGNLLSSLSDRCKISIIEDNTKYVFRISDLIKIINDSLTSNNYFFLQPIDIKNPYTNKAFSRANLYNIYFHVKSSNYKFPVLYHYYFTCDFNNSIFRTRYNYEIREHIIKNRTDQLTNPQLTEDITKMLKKCNLLFKSIFISKLFPEQLLIDAFVPFYKLYYQLCFTTNTILFYSLKDYFIKKCIMFNKVNHQFGRILHQKSSTKLKYHRLMCTEFIPYHKLNIDTVTKREVNRYNIKDSIFDYESSSDDDDSDSDDDVEVIVGEQPPLTNGIFLPRTPTTSPPISPPTTPHTESGYYLENSLESLELEESQEDIFHTNIDLEVMSNLVSSEELHSLILSIEECENNN
jgi:hypothetical protein